jgi:cell division cycle 14
MANAAFLMGAFQIIVLGCSADKAFEPFKEIKFTPFRDASYG